MANTVINNFPITVQGDGVALVATVNFSFTPASVTFVSARDSITGADTSANVLSVVLTGASALVTFAAVFSNQIILFLNTTIGPVTVSLGNTTGKTNVMQSASLVTTAVTANQVVLTYTVTALKTFYLEYLHLSALPTTVPGNGNPVSLGTISLESPAGTKLITTAFVFSAGNLLEVPFSEPIPIAAGTVIRVVVTPAATTSFTWYANFGGYEK